MVLRDASASKNTLPSARASQPIWKMHTNTKYRCKYRYKYKCAGHYAPTVQQWYLKTTFSDETYVTDRSQNSIQYAIKLLLHQLQCFILFLGVSIWKWPLGWLSSKDKYCPWFPELAFRWFLPLTVFQLSTDDSVLNYLTLDRVDILGAVLPRLPLSV